MDNVVLSLNRCKRRIKGSGRSIEGYSMFGKGYDLWWSKSVADKVWDIQWQQDALEKKILYTGTLRKRSMRTVPFSWEKICKESTDLILIAD